MITTELTDEELNAVSGGLAPLVLAGTLVTSSSFKAFASAITVVGVIAEIGTAIIDNE